MNAPAMVYVYSIPGDDDEVTRENYATACCAVQNMALAAVAEGLCLDWSTGGVTQHPELAATLGRRRELGDGRRPLHRRAGDPSRIAAHPAVGGGHLAVVTATTGPRT